MTDRPPPTQESGIQPVFVRASPASLQQAALLVLIDVILEMTLRISVVFVSPIALLYL